MNANMTTDQLLLEIIRFVKEGKKAEFHTFTDELQPYDLATIYQILPEKHRTRYLMYLDMNQLTIMIQELERDKQIEVFSKLGIEKTARIMDQMDNDDLANLLGELSQEKKEEFLSGMKQDESSYVQNIMNYPQETAGRLMTNRYVWIPENYTVTQVVEKLKVYAAIAETINYIYVIDDQRRLRGVVSYRDLILAKPSDLIADIMYSRVISVRVDTDQEEVARVIQRYDFLAVPVVEEDQALVGIITIDDILDVVIREANEDIQKLTATGGKSIDFNTKATVAAYRRLPWLILLLFIGLVSGTIISRFEETLEKVVALAFFMPMIAGMTGNTGTQSLAVVVRGLISQDLGRLQIIRLVLRELKVGIFIGLTCGVLISGIAYLWQGNPYLGLVVGSSLIATLIIGTLAGTIIPLVLSRLRIDPAVASGPLITTLNDVISLLIYFGIATMFLSYLG